MGRSEQKSSSRRSMRPGLCFQTHRKSSSTIWACRWKTCRTAVEWVASQAVCPSTWAVAEEECQAAWPSTPMKFSRCSSPKEAWEAWATTMVLAPSWVIICLAADAEAAVKEQQEDSLVALAVCLLVSSKLDVVDLEVHNSSLEGDHINASYNNFLI